MRNRYGWGLAAGLLVLVVFTGLVAAYALPRATPTAAAPAQAHTWWSMTPQQATKYLDEGRAWQRQDKPVTGLQFGLEPAKSKMVTTFDHPDTFVAVSLLVPACVMRRAGYMAEAEGSTPAERQQMVARMLESQKSLDFVGLVGPASEATAKAGVTLMPYVELETSTGQKLRLDRPTTPQELTEKAKQGEPGLAMGSNQGAYIVLVKVPVRDKAGRPWITPDTKWVRLKLFGASKTLPVTFNVAGPAPTLGQDLASRCVMGPVA